MAGERAAVARLITLAERGGDDARAALALLHPHTGRAYTVGITGAPGAGKSTLTDHMISCIRRGGDEVGVLAVDPSSPFSGGAILGDRIRMSRHGTDTGVFIRSMATRGHQGGLAGATWAAVRVLDAAGKPWVLIETVGVGQVELEVAAAADTTVVVVTPGWGDAVQAAKAGLLEVADVFAVNKADRTGADETARDLESILSLGESQDGWRPPVVKTIASGDDGTDDLWEAVLAHRQHLGADGRLEHRRTERVKEELRAIVAERLRARAAEACAGEPFDTAVASVLSGSADPHSAADALLG
ncbi:MAG: methylmalonyl Co-A mutase-associated GTPase MeaB [Acidimicrobiia bacterium]